VESVTPTYDGNGNLTCDGSFAYGYDAENRFTSANQLSTAGNCASATTAVASYAYDSQGRRKLKSVSGGATTISVYDGDQEVLSYDGTSGAIQQRFVWGLGIDDAVAQINVAASNARLGFIPDIQGSVLATLDAGSGALTKAGYLSFGESASTAGTYRYTGRRIDAETNGLYYYRARMYAPALGRFLQPDPIGYAGGVNLYAYVLNDPLNLVDAMGFASDQSQEVFCIICSAQAQEREDIDPKEVLDPLAPVRTAAFRSAMDTLRQLEPDNPNLTQLSVPGAAPTQRALDALNAEVAAAQTRALGSETFVANPGGRLGSPSTRALDSQVADILSDLGFKIVGGGGQLPQEFIPPTSSAGSGTFVDVTARGPRGLTVRVQTIDTLANGVTPTSREAAAIARIREAFPNDIILAIPKRR